MFRLLAVFPASFDLRAAEAVAGGDGVEPLASLVQLVDRSLVQYDPVDGRHQLLETLRHYAAERLAEAGESAAARERHARHFLVVTQGASPELADARYPRANAVLTAELDNLRAMADWCIDNEEWFELAGMARRLWIFVFGSAPRDDANWYAQVLEHTDVLSPQDAVDTLGEAAYIAVGSLGDYERGLVIASRSLDLADSGGLEPSPYGWLAKGLEAFFTASNPDGLRCCERALAAAEARHDELAAISSLVMIGNWSTQIADLERAKTSSAEALRRAERIGHPVSMDAAVRGSATLQC